MPRRNLLILVAIGVFSLACYQKVQSNPHARVLIDAMDLVEHRYLEEIEPEELFQGAMEGMMGRLDKYSEFIPPKDVQQFNEILDQEFGGVGIWIRSDPKTNQVIVINPVAGRPAPAYEAGIRAGDRILRIDGQSTRGLSLDDARKLMRGKPDETIALEVLHEGGREPEELDVRRKIIHIDTVKGDVRQADRSWDFFLEGHDGIGYVRLTAFTEDVDRKRRRDTSGDLRRALTWLTKRHMRGLILDLRDNPGGVLEAATRVSDMFVDSGEIVTTRRRDGAIKDAYSATKEGTFGKFPVVVLVNHRSASASEIVAACLKDAERAVVVGERTWGKGTVQEVISLLGNQGKIKLTTASYWRPSGANIHKKKDAKDSDDWGVKPDEGYEVAVDDELWEKLRDQRMQRDIPRSPENGAGTGARADGTEPVADPQLAKAVESLEETLAKQK